jgi:hypothetical protein
MPTTSGRASAAADIKTPAPMVAASATAILIDINLSTARPVRGPQFAQTKKNAGLPSHPRIFNRVS